jgi:UDP-N-acetylmuramate dehydrogenase
MHSPFTGKVVKNYPLHKITWFQVGGEADFFAKVRSIDELINLLHEKPKDMPLFILGAGSNILMRDGGFRGLIIKLAGDFSKWHIENDNTVIAGAGALDKTIALTLGEQGYTNLEFMVGIPGTIGGALIMNAGAYGSEVKDVLQWVDLLSIDGKIIRFTPDDLKMTYRKGNIPKDHLVLRAAFNVQKTSSEVVQAKLKDMLNQKEAAQPMTGRTGGSTFKNPLPHSAWQLIDKVGGRGLKNGHAQISEKHCNFLLNLGGATAKDIEDLGETVRKRVKDQEGIHMEWEIIRIGNPL